MRPLLSNPSPVGEIQTGHHRVRVILDVTVQAPTPELAIEKLRADYAGVEEQALACSIEQGKPRLYPTRALADLETSVVSLQAILSAVIAEKQGLSLTDPADRQRIADGVGELFDKHNAVVAKALLRMTQNANLNDLPSASEVKQ